MCFEIAAAAREVMICASSLRSSASHSASSTPWSSSCMALWRRCSGWGAEFAAMIGSFYAGFGPTIAGALIGAIWGFTVGFVFFALAAWLYNLLINASAGTQIAAGSRRSV